MQTFVDLIIDALLYVPKKSEIHRSCNTVLKSSNRQMKDSPCVAHRKPAQTVYSHHCLNSSYRVNHNESSGKVTGEIKEMIIIIDILINMHILGLTFLHSSLPLKDIFFKN